MTKKCLYIFIIFSALLLFYNSVAAQQNQPKEDTFFLAKKRGLIGKFGKSISRTPPEEAPVKVVNPFLKYSGKIIRSIETVRLGLEYDFEDTCKVNDNLGVRLGKAFHVNSTDKQIKRNLFFHEGDKLYPYLLADNERYLRELVYIKDARILVVHARGTTDSVDVLVLTKDVFSIGGNFAANGIKNARIALQEENLLGSGTSLSVSGLYDRERFPNFGIGGEVIRRNIGGSFIDWVSGYKDFNDAFTSGRKQETIIYTSIEKPLVTPYIRTTGAIEWSYRKTRNVYVVDSVYQSDIKYANYLIDAWFGYSLDSKKLLYGNKEKSVHSFVAIRGFKQNFITIPTLYKTAVDYRFSDMTGVLASINIFKQLFYKTNFIYGFGRSEDIPEGFSVALTGGFAKTRNLNRPYSGLDMSLTNLKKKGLYFNYTFRIGGFYYEKHFEDVDILFNVEHFTRLKKMNSNWYQRTFINAGITTQINPVLNEPLYLNSDFGFRYFNNGDIKSDLRLTVKTESVFYNTKKILGFRFAPFVFADASLLKPKTMSLQKTDLYSAIGGGIRTRNENLVFGTIELRGYYFPRVNGNMKGWKIDLVSNLRFKYKSSFISRPDFIIAN